MKRLITFSCGILILCQGIFALPRFAVKNAASCITCHVNPSGSGLRNDYGISIVSMDELPLASGMEFTDEDYSGELGDYLNIGADFRVQAFNYSNDENTRNTAFFSMQADLYASFSVSDAVTVYAEVDLLRGNTEYWTSLAVLPNDGYFRLGRHIPTYGLKLDDHSAFIRGGNLRQTQGLAKEGLPFSPLVENPVIFEWGMRVKDFYLTTSLANGYALGREQTYGFTETLGDKNLTARLEYSGTLLGLSSMAGLSYMQEQDLRLQGLFGGLSLGRITWLGEIDLAANWVADDVTTLVSYSEFVIEALQGVNMLAKIDFIDENLNFAGAALTRYTLGTEIFPMSFFEIKAQVRFNQLSESSSSAEPEYLLQLHTWF